MSKKYVDINSAYRNRRLYPNACDFVLEMNPIGRYDSSDTSNDPVLLAFPYETNLLQGGSTTTQIVLSVEASTVLNFYVDSYLEIAGNFRKIISYNPTTKVAIVDSPFPIAYPVLTQYTIRYQLPVLYDITGGPSVNLNEIVLSVGASSVNNFYNNYWVFVPGPTPPSSYQWFRIIGYNGVTKVATVAGNFSSLIGAGVNFQILAFSYDNIRPLKYYGTEIGTNQPRCSTINLVNIIVPNLPVKNGYHGTLQNYPFLYVCLYSEKGITYNTPLINNSFGNSEKYLFRCPVTYLQTNSYLTLSYSGMQQKVSFRLNDDLRLQILLPDGNPLEFDVGSPNLFNPVWPVPPNPLSQVQALFDISF